MMRRSKYSIRGKGLTVNSTVQMYFRFVGEAVFLL